MPRLFWKIFVSFWCALLVFALASIFSASLYVEHMRAEQDRAGSPHWRLAEHVRDARHIARLQGTDGLKRWLVAMDKREPIPLLLVNGRGEDLLGRPVPEWLQGRARRAHRNFLQPERRRPGFPMVYPDDGEPLVLIPDFHQVTLGRVLSRPRVMIVPVILASLVSGLVCFLLARYLAAPIRKLRVATERLAAGDLEHRIAPSLGRRRDEIVDLAHAFDRMAARLQQLMASQKQLLRDASHELRSPLARLQAAVGLLHQKSRGGPELERIEREAERLNDMISQLLYLSRLESGIDGEDKQPVDLVALINDVISDNTFEAQRDGKRIDLIEAPAIHLDANESLLRSALDNVLSNALRYTAPATAVEVRLGKDGGTVTIDVRDHGPGVPVEAQSRLFEPFFRVSDARERGSGGYGLGLAIVEHAVRAHGGSVSATNAVDGGLLVRIQLPQTPAG